MIFVTVEWESLVEEKFGEFGELSMIHQTKIIQISTNILTDLLIRQTCFFKCSKRVNSINLSPANFLAIFTYITS